MCRLRNIAMRDYKESVTTEPTDRQTQDKVIPMCHYALQATQKPDPSIEQWDSSNDWIVIKEKHVNAALALSRIPTIPSPPLCNWYHACLVLRRFMLALCSEGQLFALRCLRAISGRTSDGKEVKRRISQLGRPDPCKDRLCMVQNFCDYSI